MSAGDMKKIKKAVEEQKNQRLDNEIKRSDWLSSGATMVNLACSGTPYGAFAKGKFFWMVGESSSGKTSLTLTALAEASINPNFDEYDLIFNNSEDGALMDVEKFYGTRLAQRLKPPEIRNGEWYNSQTIDEFYYHLDDRLSLVEKGKAPPFVELLDSLDSLGSKKDREQFKKKKAAATSNKPGVKPPGDYGDGKAAMNSRYLREIVARLRDTGSILIILSQERDNVGGDLFDAKNIVAGGRALKFYATWQMWSSVGGSLTREINGTKRKIGQICRVAVKKNRLTGKEWAVEIPMYFSYGIDDIGSMVDFLCKEKYFDTQDDGKKILVPDFEFAGTREKLVQKVDKEGLKTDLTMMVMESWKDIEDACTINRTSRYT